MELKPWEVHHLRCALTNVIGFYHLLYESEGLKLSPLEQMEYQVHLTTAAMDLSTTLLRIFEEAD
ncbi:hypothetical protein [Chthonobacter rhizosphaerae]|uniref:hypothetical protein n=1 Tax=Chthonobacter rhizosphaerae TaxID=2735553 RepID=UPI0015EEEFAD|nr:hypothetical protein [Chthonobacter rhizosphaerae]